ncbi:MAG: hypothetical protein ACSHWS_11205 [Sulfitobacter sp.]
MKPNFALSLSFEGIRLLHRAAGGWRVVGEVALDADDMAAELAVLRRTASSLEPGGVRTKLLIPNEQIKYLTIPTPDMDDAARLDAARIALDGATPYAVDDLAFDISVDGDQTHVAAVARETLAEAEGFAVEHRFHPVSFVATPADQAYLGEPFFGPTDNATELLEDDETVEPDGIAVVVIGDVQIPDPAEEASEPDPTPEIVEEPELTAEPVAEPVEVDDAEAEDHTAPSKAEEMSAPEDAAPKAAEPDAQPAPLAADKSDAEIDTSIAKPDEDAAKDLVAPEATAPTEDVKSPKASDEKPKEEVAENALSAEDEGTPPAKPPIPKMPSLGAASRGNVTPPAPVKPNTPIAAPLPVVEKTADAPATPTAGFASRRSTDAPAASTALPGARREPLLGTPKPNAATQKAPAPGVSVSDPSVPDLDDAALKSAAIKPDSSSLAPQIPEATPAPKASFLSRRKSKAAKSAKPTPYKRHQPEALAEEPGSEAERMTIFGARRMEVGGKPRFLGLMLTAALLVFLAGVAAWASVFLDDGLKLSRLFGDRSPRTTASIPDPPKTTVEGIQTASLDPGLTEEDGAVLDALSEPIVPDVEVMTEAEAEAKYAATGIWPRAPQVPPEPATLIDIDDLYMTSIDPVSTSSDAVALPAVEGFLTDVGFGAVSSPAAAGTQFALDARGLVIPTAQGALSPDGFTVFLGRPAVLPPTTLKRPGAVPEDTTTSDALAGVRPRVRPEDLIENTERAQLDGLTRSELADLRPRLRPASIQQLAEAAQAPAPETATVDTSDAIAAALAAAPVPAPAIENATRFAVKASVRPDTRPRNFARIVRRAKRAAPQQETQVASAASVAPRAVSPKIPSKASVARQATVKNAINLRKVNLIGVYGKPSRRRALVRLGNGRYKKVVVGDRIDGGRVSAIGDSELRYTKRGRSVVLKMPR